VIGAPFEPWGTLASLKDFASLGRASGVLQHPPGLYSFLPLYYNIFYA
jgi:hypothetical protein